MTQALEIEGLDVRYGQTRALSEVSLTVGAGEVVALVGANGAGKSSMLNALMGLVPQIAGRMKVCGATVDALPTRERILAGLAPRIVQEIAAFVRNVRAEGVSVVLAEQNAEMALGAADRAYVLQNGEVVMSGPAGEVAADPQVRAAYLGL